MPADFYLVVEDTETNRLSFLELNSCWDQPWGRYLVYNVHILSLFSLLYYYYPSQVQLFCDCMDCSPPDSSVHGISQARILEWVAVSFSRGSSRLRDWTPVSCVSCIGRQILYYCATWETQTRYTHGQNTLKDAQHHGDANQNHNEIPYHTH